MGCPAAIQIGQTMTHQDDNMNSKVRALTSYVTFKLSVSLCVHVCVAHSFLKAYPIPLALSNRLDVCTNPTMNVIQSSQHEHSTNQWRYISQHGDTRNILSFFRTQLMRSKSISHSKRWTLVVHACNCTISKICLHSNATTYFYVSIWRPHPEIIRLWEFPSSIHRGLAQPPQ